ncbi:MAG: DNA repair protein RadC [Chloroflexia bacterium]|nr:DNA repair protein RadC [Chloroflexia bacterium]
MENKLPITNWAIEDRPREKLLAKGIQSLSDAELIAILIGSGSRNESAVDLSKRILASVKNNLNQLGKLTINELQNFKGIGEAKAISIVAAMELGKRRKISDVLEREKISSSKDAFELFAPILGDLPHEEFWVLFLDRSNKIIDKQRTSQGGVSGTVIDIRMVLKQAIEKLSSGIILCHNHPSGNPQPSKSDIDITRKLKEAAGFMDINVLDHIIVTDSEYFSFLDKSLMNETTDKKK